MLESTVLMLVAACHERRRMKSFINYRISATLQLLVFFFIGVFALHPNEFHQVRWSVGDTLQLTVCAGAGQPDWLTGLRKPAFRQIAHYTACLHGHICCIQGYVTRRIQTGLRNPCTLLMLAYLLQTGEGETFPRFFMLPVLMLMLITLLNDGTLISIGYDRVKPSHMPEKWNLKVNSVPRVGAQNWMEHVEVYLFASARTGGLSLL